jgi:hypothetical protein
MFQTKRRRIVSKKSNECSLVNPRDEPVVGQKTCKQIGSILKDKKEIKNIIVYNRVTNKYLVEWSDLTRTWEENVPKNFHNTNSSYIS